MFVDLLEGQFHVLVLIIIVQVIPKIVHGQKIHHIYAVIYIAMFCEMRIQRRQFQQFIQRTVQQEKWQ